MLTERFADALAYAFAVHRSQERKGSKVPYVAHLLGVSSLVLEYSGDEDEAIAGLLHDTVEDQGGTQRLESVRARFGHRVAEIVHGCTDSVAEPKPPWRERKQEYVAHLRASSSSVRLVAAADKLYNARCIVEDYRALGPRLWSRFTGGRDGVLWYYRAVCGALAQPDDARRMALVAELDRTVRELETLCRAEALPGAQAFGACRHAPLRLPESLSRELEAAYGEPYRAYHTAAHVADVLAWYERVADEVGWERPAETYVAILFHDAIYVPGARDNEAQSAAWARRAGLPVDVERVAALIELTGKHGALVPGDLDRDAALFLDCDMAILGATADEFDAYDAAIAREYANLPSDVYRAGRRAFLTRLAGAPRIFLSDYFHERLDAAARANIGRALSRGGG